MPDSRVVDGLKVLLSGVGGCKGPDGAKEKRLPVFLGSDDDDAGRAKVKGLGASVLID